MPVRTLPSPALPPIFHSTSPMSPNEAYFQCAPLQTDDIQFKAYEQFETPFACKQRPLHEDLCTISFADELFEDGRIRPLKLPPRLQHFTTKKCSKRSSLPISPTVITSLGSRTCFTILESKSKDFDPFLAALEHVSKEETTAKDQSSSRRRARSLSPLRSSLWHRGSPCKEEGSCKHCESSASTALQLHASSINSSGAKMVGSGKSSCRESKRKGIKHLLFRNLWEGRYVGNENCHEIGSVVFEEVRKKNLAPYQRALLTFFCFGL